MRLRNLIHLLLATAFYGIYYTIIYLQDLVPSYLGTTLVLDSPNDAKRLTSMIHQFQDDAIPLLAVSFVCFLVWYFVSEYVIKVDARESSFYTLFCVLLLVIVGAACYEVYDFGSQYSDIVKYPHNMVDVALFYFLTSTFFFYLATVLCSPPNARYYIWPSKHVWRN